MQLLAIFCSHAVWMKEPFKSCTESDATDVSRYSTRLHFGMLNY